MCRCVNDAWKVTGLGSSNHAIVLPKDYISHDVECQVVPPRAHVSRPALVCTLVNVFVRAVLEKLVDMLKNQVFIAFQVRLAESRT